MEKNSKAYKDAFTSIIIFGIISMLGDVVYETARSANGQYLNLLSISASKVGLVFGIGEFLGYFIRLVAGILSDKTKKPWLFMFIGYGMLIVVPIMGLSNNWNILLILILLERIGKAIRNPAKDTVLSAAAEGQFGLGLAFGIQEAVDQIGAFVGPLIFTAVFYFTGKNGLGEYQLGYKLLFIPYIILMVFLAFVYFKNLTKEAEAKSSQEPVQEDLNKIFWTYTAFTFFSTLGFVNFSTIGYHLKAENLFTDGNITLLYALAMVVDSVAALVVGKTYDKLKIETKTKTGGVLVLALVPLMTVLLPILTLSKSKILIIFGMILFGIVMGSHETIMRSAIADLVPYKKRGTGYGIFNTGYGLALLIGSAGMGFLYDKNLIYLITILTAFTEIFALFLFFRINKMVKADKNI